MVDEICLICINPIWPPKICFHQYLGILMTFFDDLKFQNTIFRCKESFRIPTNSFQPICQWHQTSMGFEKGNLALVKSSICNRLDTIS